LSVLADSTKVHAVDNEPLLARVTAFLGPFPRFPTTVTWRHISSYPMERGRGGQTTWLQLQAAINKARDQEK